MEDYTTNIYKNVLSKYLQWDSNKDLLSLFSLWVCGNFKLPSQRKHNSNGNKNIIFVEAKVMNIFAKFRLHSLLTSEEMLFFFFLCVCVFFFSRNYLFGCHGNQSTSAVWTKFICLLEDHSRNSSKKLLSKYLQWDRNKGLLSLLPL